MKGTMRYCEGCGLGKMRQKNVSKEQVPMAKNVGEYLIAGIQQELMWEERDHRTFEAIQQGKIDWSGDVRSKRRTRKHIRKRS